MNHSRSLEAFEDARALMPGGVSSPARACRSVGASPVFLQVGSGPHVLDEDHNRYLDLVGAFGPMILGHGHPDVVTAVTAQVSRGLSFGTPTLGETGLVQRVIAMVPGVERMRLVSSGTEATMSALRTARGFTGRHRIIKCAGCYHGHADALLVQAGSGAMTLGTPDSAGVTPGAAQDTLVAPYNDLDAMGALFEAHPDEIAAVIIEPVAGNMGVVPPERGYLEGLRELTSQHGAVLIFDEVMTGFRVHLGGAQALYRVTPDMTCLGKIVGGGLPVGAYGGRADIMAHVAPEGPVYQAGTNSGNPLSVAAGIATLDVLARGDVHPHLETLGAQMEAGLNQVIDRSGADACVQRVGSMITLFFVGGPVRQVDDVTPAATERFGAFWRHMLDHGVMLPPSQYEAWFLNGAMNAENVDEVVQAAGAFFSAAT